MAVEGGLAAVIRSFLRDQGRMRCIVDRLWDVHRRAVCADFLLAQQNAEDGTHHIYEWEELLLAFGSGGRYQDLQRYFDLLRAQAWSEAEEEAYGPLEELGSDAEGWSDAVYEEREAPDADEEAPEADEE